MSQDLGRPIRVVLFGGAFPEHTAVRFVARLATHSEVEFVGGIYQGNGFSWRERVREIVRRRGIMAPVAISYHVAQGVWPLLRHPAEARRLRRDAAPAFAHIISVPDIHAPHVLEHVRALDADMGLIYGAPVLRPELFTIPRLGTLGIHHGTLPHYRGKKTTFWEMFNGERTAGVAIQRVNAGLDTGEIIRAGEVLIGGKGYRRVEREVNALGIALYLAAILDVKRGVARPRPQPPGVRVRPYRQPGLRDTLRLLGRWPGRAFRAFSA